MNTLTPTPPLHAHWCCAWSRPVSRATEQRAALTCWYTPRRCRLHPPPPEITLLVRPRVGVKTHMTWTYIAPGRTAGDVRVPSRSIPPPWGSIRFRLALRTHAPWGCIVRVVPDRQTKSRKVPTRNVTALLFCDQAYSVVPKAVRVVLIIRDPRKAIPSLFNWLHAFFNKHRGQQHQVRAAMPWRGHRASRSACGVAGRVPCGPAVRTRA